MSNYLACHKDFLYEMEKYKILLSSSNNLKEEEK